MFGMPYRTNTTGDRSIVHVEAPRPDELARGVPAPAREADPPEPVGGRLPTGQFAAGSTAKEHARRGGLARAEKMRTRVRALECLGLVDLPTDSGFHPYLIQSEEWALAECTRLAQEVGAGHCPISAATIIQSSALQLAASRYLFAHANGDEKKLATASRLADSARQGLLCAHELTVRTAQQRPKGDGMPDDLKKFFVSEGP